MADEFDRTSSLVIHGDVRPVAGPDTVEAVCIVDGLVTAIGSFSDVLAAAPSGIRTVRHDGVVAPGFVDSHVHAMWLGRAGSRLQLDECTSVPEMLSRIRVAAGALPPSEWLLGSAGFDEAAVAERRLPTLLELDEATGGRPLLLDRRGHDGLANSAALHRAGVTAGSPDPDGGHFARDENGSLTGELVEHSAVEVVTAVIPQDTDAQRRQWIRSGLGALARVGVTCAADPALSVDELAAYCGVHEDTGLPIGAVVFPRAVNGSDPDIFWAEVEATGVHRIRSTRLRLGPVKLFVDGGGMLGTALRHTPWPGTSSCGVQSTSTATLERYVEWAARRGRGLALHTVGPAAVDLVLDLLRRPVEDGTLATWSGTGTHLIHAYLEQHDDSAKLAASLGVGLAAQPALSRAALSSVQRRLGEGAAATVGRLAAWLAEGVVVGGGSDAPGPSAAPAVGISLARKEIGSLAAWRLHTEGAAALLGTNSGRLAPGCPGDVALLAADPLTAGDEELAAPDFVRGAVTAGTLGMFE